MLSMQNVWQGYKTCRERAEHLSAEQRQSLSCTTDGPILPLPPDGIPSRADKASITHLRPLAEQGNADAQVKLGQIYELGLGVAHDYVEALKWYRKAAEQGNADAQYYLGEMYRHGVGVKQDRAEALKWYRKAAAQGATQAQIYIGEMSAEPPGSTAPNW